MNQLQIKSVDKDNFKPPTFLIVCFPKKLMLNIILFKHYQHLTEHFENLDVPTGKQGVLHPFISIVMIALLATIGGATGWEDIETYG